jgi:predicted metal-dependent peptidase
MQLATKTEEKKNHFAKAKVQLVLNHSFYAVLSCHLPTVPVGPEFFLMVQIRLRRETGNQSIVIPPTALVDGKKIYYNAAWVEKMPEKQRLGLLAHEVTHPALQHPWRRGNRRMDLWHRATDYAVNDILLRTTNPDGKPAFELPPGGLFEQRFSGMAAEQIYNILLKEEKEEEEQQKKGGQPKPGKGKGKGEALDSLVDRPIDPDDADGTGKNKGKGKGKGKPKPEKKGGGKDDKPDLPQMEQPGAGKSKNEEKDEKEEQEEDQNPGESKSQKNPGKKEDGEAEEDEQDEDESEEPSEEESDDESEEADESEEDSDTSEGQGQPGDGGPADQHEGHGGAHDHACAELEDSDASLQEEWKSLLQQAAMVAKSRGQLPGQLARLVEEVSEPRVPWQQIIEQFVNDIVRDDYDMMKQDRRFIQQGIYFPDLQSNATTVAAFLDTSGSIGLKELKFYVSEVASICRCRGVKYLRLLCCDAEITLDLCLSATDPLPENFPGGGGTDFRPPFKRVKEEGERPSLVIYFTDLMGTFPETDPGVPTIWLWSKPAWTKDAEAPDVPFGTVIGFDPLEDDEDAA